MSEANPTVIQPTIGRQVWYFPSLIDPGTRNLDNQRAATIVFVHGPRLVNLQVLEYDGRARPELNVPLMQPGDVPPPDDFRYCTWMPFQVGQASKAAELAGQLEQARKVALVSDLINKDGPIRG